jgi:peptidoglycan/xylan/chitin deacetylase (PgdA/CDA1 family)
MRSALALAITIIMATAAAFAGAQDSTKAQIRVAANPSPASEATPQESAPAPAPTPTGFPALTKAKCNNPNALGVSRVVEIDTRSGPGFGFENFKAYDFLNDHEVVLTFDDGPWPGNTERVLKALADQCTKAMFFSIGEHAGWHPELEKMYYAAGMTVGTHTWSHKDLTKMSFEDAKAEVEKGIAAVSIAAGYKPVAPFFRFPALRMPPEILKYLVSRHISSFSTDIDTFDFKMNRPAEVVHSVMTKLAKRGKGILLMHDFRHATSLALPEILKDLKKGGYKIVQVVAKKPLEPLPEYKQIVLKEMGGGLAERKPMSSIIKTISGPTAN